MIEKAKDFLKPESEDGHARRRHWLQLVSELLDQLGLILLLRAGNEHGIGSFETCSCSHLRVVVVVVGIVRGEGLALLPMLLFGFSVVGAAVA